MPKKLCHICCHVIHLPRCVLAHVLAQKKRDQQIPLSLSQSWRLGRWNTYTTRGDEFMHENMYIYVLNKSLNDGWVHGLNKYNPTEPSRKIFMIISAMYLLCSISGVVLHFWRFTDIFAQGTRVVHVIAIMLALHNLALPCHLGHLLSTYGIWTFFGIYNPKLFKFNHLIIQ